VVSPTRHRSRCTRGWGESRGREVERDRDPPHCRNKTSERASARHTRTCTHARTVFVTSASARTMAFASDNARRRSSALQLASVARHIEIIRRCVIAERRGDKDRSFLVPLFALFDSFCFSPHRRPITLVSSAPRRSYI